MLYCVIIDDRHTDTDVEIFSKEEEAIFYARKTARAYSIHPEDIEEYNYLDTGRKFRLALNYGDGCLISVWKKEIDTYAI